MNNLLSKIGDFVFTYIIEPILDTYWKIDDADKPLKVPSAYTIKELQEIAEKLGIILMNELGKNKTKPILYQEILSFF